MRIEAAGIEMGIEKVREVDKRQQNIEHAGKEGDRREVKRADRRREREQGCRGNREWDTKGNTVEGKKYREENLRGRLRMDRGCCRSRENE